jgi:hypothetical protein
VESKREVCLQGDGNHKTITIASIRDDGTAFGAVANGSATSDAGTVVAQLMLTRARVMS